MLIIPYIFRAIRLMNVFNCSVNKHYTYIGSKSKLREEYYLKVNIIITN